MQDFLSKLFSGLLFLFLTVAGLVITFFFIAFAITALGVLYIVSLFRGKKFSAADYWRQTRQRAQNTQTQFNDRFKQPSYSRRRPQEVTDVDIREIGDADTRDNK